MGLPVLYLVNLTTLSSNGVVSTEVGEALGKISRFQTSLFQNHLEVHCWALPSGFLLGFV